MPVDQAKAIKALGRFAAAIKAVVARFPAADRDDIMAMLACAIAGDAVAGAQNKETMVKTIATVMADAAARP